MSLKERLIEIGKYILAVIGTLLLLFFIFIGVHSIRGYSRCADRNSELRGEIYELEYELREAHRREERAIKDLNAITRRLPVAGEDKLDNFTTEMKKDFDKQMTQREKSDKIEEKNNKLFSSILTAIGILGSFFIGLFFHKISNLKYKTKEV